MKKAFITAVCVCLIFLLLSACGTTRTAAGLVIEVPHERYFRDNERPVMITEEAWAKLTDEEKESEYTRIATESINSLNACNIDKKTLRVWRDQMLELKKKYE